METIHLKQFAITGAFGKIKMGATKTEVTSLLGKKYDFADCNDSYILKYGWYEFFFWTESNTLFGIQNDSLSGMENDKKTFLFRNKKFKIYPWFFKKQKFTFKKVIEILNKQNIAYSVNTDQYTKIEFDSAVYFDFITEKYVYNNKIKNWEEEIITNREDYILNGIRLFDYR